MTIIIIITITNSKCNSNMNT